MKLRRTWHIGPTLDAQVNECGPLTTQHLHHAICVEKRQGAPMSLRSPNASSCLLIWGCDAATMQSQKVAGRSTTDVVPQQQRHVLLPPRDYKPRSLWNPPSHRTNKRILGVGSAYFGCLVAGQVALDSATVESCRCRVMLPSRSCHRVNETFA